jgi:GT2 family glycosyltransferase
VTVLGAIIARNGGPLLAEALADLTTALGAANILVVDNASTDGSTESLSVAVDRVPVNLGYAGGAARALAWAERTGGKALLLLNQDARLPAGTARRLIDLLHAGPDCGAAFAKIVRADRPFILDGGHGRVNLRHKLTTDLGDGSVDPGDGPPERIEHGHGAVLLLDVRAAAAVGGFDSDLFAYHEEVDLCWRLRRAGYLVAYDPAARAPHHGPHADPARTRAKNYLLARNSLRVARKNGGRLAALRVAAWAALASLVYYGPLALAGDLSARALLAGWRDGLRGGPVPYRVRALL